jgi:hypothetical protein
VSHLRPLAPGPCTTGTLPYVTPLAIQRLVAGLLLLIIPLTRLSLTGTSSADLGAAVALFLTPAMASQLRDSRLGVALVGLTIASIASGELLSRTITVGPRHIDATLRLHADLLLISALALIITIVWARSLLEPSTIALLFAIGLTLNDAMTPESWKGDPWKYAFSWPLTLAAMALATRLRPRVGVIVVLGVASVISIPTGYRSFLAACIVAIAIQLWRLTITHRHSTRSQMITAVLLAITVVGAYQALTTLALSGALGIRNQIVSEQQVAQSGSIIVGGRPEWAAAVSLFASRPVGLGSGVIPSTNDINVGKAGLLSVGVDTNSVYVNDYLFAGPIELHSVASDLWVTYGLPGLFVALLCGYVLLSSIFQSLTRPPHSPPGFLILPALWGLWDLAYSPMASNLYEVVFATSMCIALKPLEETRSPSAARPRPLQGIRVPA